MRNACVYNVEELVLGSLLVKHDTIRNVNYLNDRLAFMRALFDLDIFILMTRRVKYFILFLNNFKDLVFNFIIFGVQKVSKTILLIQRNLIFGIFWVNSLEFELV